MAKELKIACVGLDDKSSLLVRSVVKLYARTLKTAWRVVNDAGAEAVANMSADVDANVTLVDLDSEAGRRAWYVLQALRGDVLAALTDFPDKVQADHVISKPLRPKDLVAILQSFE